MRYFDLSGFWECETAGRRAGMRLPGTLDENGIGFPDDPTKQWKVDEVERIGFWQPGDPIVTRLTRKHTFEGAANLSRRIEWDAPKDRRVFVDVERARHLRLRVNGQEARLYRPASLSAPYTFEVTGLTTGHDQFSFLSDNSYPGWPREAIQYSSAASDETQTNWNGLLGLIRIRTEGQIFLSDVRVYPRDDQVQIAVEIDAACSWQGILHFSCDALAEETDRLVRVTPGIQEFCFDLKLKEGAPRWDLEEGNLCHLTVSAPGLEPYEVRFGIRTFRAEKGHLTLNHRRIFLRGEANCAVFPETGYCPMDVESWKTVLQKYRSYGVNCMRFHSHCPPEAAFTAADEMGMLMQPELSHWDPVHAFETEEARRYYRDELMQILRHLANHPSFVMLTFGNELQAGAAGHAFMNELLQSARQYDSTRLYANASNAHYGANGEDPQSDFYTAMRYHGLDMRATCDGMTGWLNNEYPNARHDYSDTVAAIRGETRQPVFSFEVGQYEVLPDFDEIRDYHGITSPENLKHIQRKAKEKGLEADWQRRVGATGESSLLCYRAEVEAALRTEGYSGISLLGLQDFPGQGTALTGMMNAHLQQKPYDFAQPERFASFFRDTLPLALLEKYTYTAGETLTVPVRIANYGRKDLSGPLEWTLQGTDDLRQGRLPEAAVPAGSVKDHGIISVPLDGFEKATRLTLTVSFCGNANEYPLWVYPETRPVCPASVHECRSFDEKARSILRDGGIVYLSPDSTREALPHSIQAQFSPDFWSVCTFGHQAGGMGQLIDESHPLFQNFPTESWNNWQWWIMAGQRAMILPEKIRCIVEEMDSYAFLRPMAKMFECRCGNGRLLVSSLGLHRLQQYPETRALLAAVYTYMSSNRFCPTQKLSENWIGSILNSQG
ncbi:MAG: hypothetical protein IKD50_04545 [Clostridia bacterium]|nr:hypothetical protein [Clostridia bacterium]